MMIDEDYGDDDNGDEDNDDGEKRENDKYNLYDQEFNPHRLAHGNSKTKEGLGFFLPDIISISQQKLFKGLRPFFSFSLSPVSQCCNKRTISSSSSL